MREYYNENETGSQMGRRNYSDRKQNQELGNYDEYTQDEYTDGLSSNSIRSSYRQTDNYRNLNYKEAEYGYDSSNDLRRSDYIGESRRLSEIRNSYHNEASYNSGRNKYSGRSYNDYDNADSRSRRAAADPYSRRNGDETSRDAWRRENEYNSFENNEEYIRERDSRNARQRDRRRRKIRTIIIVAVISVVAIFALILVFGNIGTENNSSSSKEITVSSEENKPVKEKKKSSEDKEKKTRAQIMETAAYQAAQYDYDAAINTLKTIKNYENREDVMQLITEYETTRDSCVAYPVEEITHVFFHALLYEPEVSFGATSTQPNGYNQYMTTVDEFIKIIQSMYVRGYVLVSIYDVASAGEDGTFQAGTIMLPPGKKAFVLSEDDVNYYHAYDNGGIAEKLVIDSDTGKVKTRYIYQDGTVEIGNHDVVPILDEFIEQHPDFSYRGAKGILALTGYNGILGYRTDPTYNTTEDRDSHQQAWLDAHPDFNYEEECAEASRVAQALKDDGWLLASHSWGHLWQEKMSDNGFAIDAEKWMTSVYPLIGGTDIWIYPNGQDVDNDVYANRFNTLYNYGFRYFCPVNSSQYSVRIDSYGLNMGRRNLDGYRMYYDMIDDSIDRLSDLFDVNEVFDPARPTPVPEI